MTLRADNRRRWQVPYGIATIWSAYVLMFLGGVYLLVREYAAVHHAAAYANESILWDVSQLQRELLRLGLLLERTQALSASASPKALWMVGLPRLKSASSMHGKSSWISE